MFNGCTSYENLTVKKVAGNNTGMSGSLPCWMGDPNVTAVERGADGIGSDY